MKQLLLALTILVFISCDKKKSTEINNEDIAELRVDNRSDSQEEATRTFIKEYIAAFNDKDWQTKAPKYMQPGDALDAFLEEHAAFRKAFPDYKSTIKHLMVDGNKGMLWLANEGTYTNSYSFDNSTYGDEILLGVDANNQKLSWDETWYFDVVNGRFGNEWDFIKDHKKVMEGLGLKTAP